MSPIRCQPCVKALKPEATNNRVLDSPLHQKLNSEYIGSTVDKRVSQMRAPLAARREPAGVKNSFSVLYIFLA